MNTFYIILAAVIAVISVSPTPSTAFTEWTTPDHDLTTSATTGSETSASLPSENRPPRVGDNCDPELCENIGYCQSYLRCDKTTAKLVKEECGLNLVWNPLNPNGTQQIHGGNCDVWGNLRPEVERKYRTDTECLGCFWKSLGDCSRDYDYQAPNCTHRTVLRLTCATGLVFSQAKETCQRCEDVVRQDGRDCCGNDSDGSP